jgi:exosortase E/protease (VPEID-CTERM system)
MSCELAPARSAHPVRSLTWVRWACLSALLFGEVMFLTVRFDTGTIYHIQGWWADLMGQSWIIPQVCIAVTAALLLFGGSRLREEFRSVAAQPTPLGQMWPLLAGHLTVYLAFTAVTGVLLGGHIENYAHPEWWAVLWLVMAAATGITWFAMILAPRLWLTLIKHAWIPLLVGLGLGVAAWGAGRVTKELWRPLSETTLRLDYFLLRLVVPDVRYDPSQCLLGTDRFYVTVAPACSGYEGIGLIWVFLGGFLWFFRHTLRFPQAFLLFPLGTLVIYLANVLRIFGLILLGSYGSEEIALGGFHSQAGWLALNGVALGMVGFAGRSAFFSKTVAGEWSGNASAAYLAPFLALVLVNMLTLIVTHGGFDYYYALRIFAVAAVLLCYRKVYQVLSWRCSWEALVAGVGVFALWMGLEWMALDPTAQAASNDRFAAGLYGMGASWARIWLLFRVLGSVIAIPIAEELAFRGYLSRRLIATDFEQVPMGQFTWFSFVLSSVAFGMLHGRMLAGVLAGMIFALVVCRTKRLSDAIWAHAITNGLIAAYVLTTSTWTLW